MHEVVLVGIPQAIDRTELGLPVEVGHGLLAAGEEVPRSHRERLFLTEVEILGFEVLDLHRWLFVSVCSHMNKNSRVRRHQRARGVQSDQEKAARRREGCRGVEKRCGEMRLWKGRLLIDRGVGDLAYAADLNNAP